MEKMALPLEIKAVSEGDSMSFSGYGAVFGNTDAYGDVIEPGAFAKTLRDSKSSGVWPSMKSEHGSMFGGDANLPVGIWTKMEEDNKGLYVEGTLAPTQRGKDIYTLLKMAPRPALSGLSIGYSAIAYRNRSSANEPRRTLTEIKLYEVSLVDNPANTLARVEGVKSITTIREFEEFLRDAGYSRAAAKAIASGGFKAADPRDEDEADAVAAILRRNIATLSGG